MKKKSIKRFSLNKKRISQLNANISLGGIRNTLGGFSCVQGATCSPTQMVTICFTTCVANRPGCDAQP